ncbi:MAG: HAD family hydrolase [Desulfobacca sp.]|uniref:HAD family hydrolase n=1 Tax=Desulfobacca sp. TaxID=2067990 RepID=UPI004049C6FA
MLTIDIPGYKKVQLAHLVTDYNGTVAVDGRLADGVAPRLQALSRQVAIHIITADTFGQVQQEVAGLPCRVVVIGRADQAGAKLRYVQELGAEQTVCLGNGRNDHLMLRAAGLGIAVLLAEGAAGVTIQAADVVTAAITDALDLLLKPLRLIATLRS